MQQLSNDTGSWSLIESPLPAPLFYNSNTYETLSNGGAINEYTNPIIPIPLDSLSSLRTQTGVIENNSVNYWAFALIIFPLFTIFGNVLVVVSVYREKSLHTVTNYFVVSLAISDITVAAVVMPFAIYLEYNGVWKLSERLCDFWVASDCMACTASILNLVAIAVDRYIAVTKPLKYARHKNPKRVAIMIVIVWLVSFFIALPIVSGINKSDIAAYPRSADECAFFNNKFLIFSSLGSFFIPCIIIFAIYYRIFLVIMAQAKKNRKQWRPKAAIESAAAAHRSNVDNLVTSFLHERQDSIHPPNNDIIDNNNISENPQKHSKLVNQSVPLINNNNNESTPLGLKSSSPATKEKLRASINITSSSGDPLDDDERDDVALFVHDEQKNTNNNNTTTNNKTDHDNQIEILSSTIPKSNSKFDNSTGFQTHVVCKVVETENHHQTTNSFKTRLKTETNSQGLPITTCTSQANNVKIAKRKAYSRMKKERKATQTLIIVLICFLVCWLPFFVLNNLVNAIFKLLKKSNNLLIKDITLLLCIWLGYINSFLNPIIYTIFNLEFRKAFVKILFSPCRATPTNSAS
ncbi:unnamed protein product [Adineta steineri]|uniref:G-protein coupled receptors family 1 profile domain-containing protein n=1 Tax=Adineta steineri TaxID=433720 RepID=A0A814BPZ9_9BILA|nr:unnamed protein product [Adineta steineri]CAF3492677.1 unnamed protein product [Adineta steineri]